MLMPDTATLISATASFATSFWEAFWPNLASTLVGAAIGVPVGLYINRHAVRFTERRSLRAENQLLQRTLTALDAALECNYKVLSLLVDKKKREAHRLIKPLDTGTWDAVRTLLPSSFRDPELLRRLAYHWVQLGQVTAMHHMILQQQLVASSHSPPPMLSAMQNECDAWLMNLLTDSMDLRGDLKSYLTNNRP
jgi:AraC-like DNA-binding protein